MVLLSAEIRMLVKGNGMRMFCEAACFPPFCIPGESGTDSGAVPEKHGSEKPAGYSPVGLFYSEKAIL